MPSDPQRDAMSDALGDQVTPQLKRLADLVESILERVGPIEERLGRIEQRLTELEEV